MEMASDGGGIGPLILLGIAAYFVWGASASSDTVTVYKMQCISKASFRLLDVNECANRSDEDRIVSATKYRVDFEKQRVFEILIWITRYDDCMVVDAANWLCTEKASTRSFGMINGTFTSPDKTEKVISYPTYLIYRWGLAT